MPEDDPDIYAILMKHESRIARIEGELKILIAINLGMISLLIAEVLKGVI